MAVSNIFWGRKAHLVYSPPVLIGKLSPREGQGLLRVTQ